MLWSEEFKEMLALCKELLPALYEDMQWSMAWNALREDEMITMMQNSLLAIMQ